MASVCDVIIEMGEKPIAPEVRSLALDKLANMLDVPRWRLTAAGKRRYAELFERADEFQWTGTPEEHLVTFLGLFKAQTAMLWKMRLPPVGSSVVDMQQLCDHLVLDMEGDAPRIKYYLEVRDGLAQHIEEGLRDGWIECDMR
jgi:hypothetical protein